MSADNTPAPPRPKARRPLTPEQKAEVAAATYEQGFGKPPKSTQFKKGASGNPSGRPKEARSLRTDLLAVLDLEVQIQLPSGPEKVSLQKAMLFAAGAKAAKGDMRATQVVTRLMELATPERLKETTDATQLSPTEQAQMELLLTAFGVGGGGATELLAAAAMLHQSPAPEALDGDDEDPGFSI